MTLLRTSRVSRPLCLTASSCCLWSAILMRQLRTNESALGNIHRPFLSVALMLTLRSLVQTASLGIEARRGTEFLYRWNLVTRCAWWCLSASAQSLENDVLVAKGEGGS
ncbi:hypothetical protein E2C01_047146 [Portunus trituberculatus]|uniref:Uncharacterized protein n=1 Tax=Portunus trituberculatus TaxID=210409 RepID=A0A5B7G6R5_PORTR|nr:hypothetical protein [Portunus trituberculatus]